MEDRYNHYTTPTNAIGISKNGIVSRGHRPISVYYRPHDVIMGENIDDLWKEVNKHAGWSNRRGEKVAFGTHPANLEVESILSSGKDSDKLVFMGSRDEVTGKLGAGSCYHRPKNPSGQLITMDGLYLGGDGSMDPKQTGVYSFTTVKKRTSSPVRFVVCDGVKDLKKRPGCDMGEIELCTESIGKKNLRVEIPRSGITDRSSDIKHLRRYLKGHKGLVNPTRETMEALYGSKFPGLDRFPTEKELLTRLELNRQGIIVHKQKSRERDAQLKREDLRLKRDFLGRVEQYKLDLLKKALEKARLSRESIAHHQELADALRKKKELGERLKKVGAIAGGLALASGLAYGGKKIYDHYKNKKQSEDKD